MIFEMDRIRRISARKAAGAGLLIGLAAMAFSQTSRPRDFAREDGVLPASKVPPDRPYTHAWPREKFVAIAVEAGYDLVKADADYRMHQVLVFRLSGRPAVQPAE